MLGVMDGFAFMMFFRYYIQCMIKQLFFSKMQQGCP